MLSSPTKSGTGVSEAVELELDETVVVVVVPVPVHPEIVDVEQVVCVIIATVELLVPPDKNEVEREIV